MARVILLLHSGSSIAVLVGGLGLIVGFILALTDGIVAKLTRLLFTLAVSRLPEVHHARFSEEWQSHLSDIESRFAKLRASVGFLIAGHAIRRLPSASVTKAGSLFERDSDVSPTSHSAVHLTEIISRLELEKQTIMLALERLNGDKMATLRLLGVGKTTLYRKLREQGIKPNNNS